jgi:hypothetical protein
MRPRCRQRILRVSRWGWPRRTLPNRMHQHRCLQLRQLRYQRCSIHSGQKCLRNRNRLRGSRQRPAGHAFFESDLWTELSLLAEVPQFFHTLHTSSGSQAGNRWTYESSKTENGGARSGSRYVPHEAFCVLKLRRMWVDQSFPRSLAVEASSIVPCRHAKFVGTGGWVTGRKEVTRRLMITATSALDPLLASMP